MTDVSACPTIRDGDDEVARQWAASSLAPGAADEFEAHLLTCSRCQRAVEQASAITAALRAAAVGHRVRHVPSVWMRWSIPFAVAAAAVVVSFWPRDPLRALSDPGPAPLFSSAAVRADGDGAGDADRGMAAFQERDYAGAASLLTTSVAGGNATPGLQFFLGVSRLLSGDAAGAIDALGPGAADQVSPYAPEAQLWLAKAWLQLGEADSAQRVLQVLAGRSDVPTLSAHARALADSIRKVRKR